MNLACNEVNDAIQIKDFNGFSQADDYDSIIWGEGSYELRRSDKILDMINRQLIPIAENEVIIESVRANNKRTEFIDKNLEMEEMQKINRMLKDYFLNSFNKQSRNFLSEMLREIPCCFKISILNDKCLEVISTDHFTGENRDDKINFYLMEGSNSIFIKKVKFFLKSETSLMRIYLPIQDRGNVIGYLQFSMDADDIDMTVH